MRKEMLWMVCAVGLFLWGGAQADAKTVTWYVLTHSSIAGHGPGADRLIGTSDDTTTGERNKCNFTVDVNCATGTTPSIGSYTYGATELDGDVTHSCGGGDLAGEPCACAEPPGQPCTSDAQCSPSSCAGGGDCCPSDPLTLSPCLQCTQDDPPGEPFGPPMDAYQYSGSYFGSLWSATGRVFTCQEADPPGDTDPDTDFEFKIADMAVSEVTAGYGGGCLNLKRYSGPYLASPCTGSGPVSGTFDLETFHTGCNILGGTIDNIDIQGDIIDITDPNNPNPATATCGYGSDDLKTIAANAVAVNGLAKHLMIICGDTTHSPTSQKACMRNAYSYLAWVLYTTDDASECPDNDCPYGP